MKIIGKNSLLYWLRVPFLIYVAGFLLLSMWIFGLMIIYAITKKTNQFITESTWNNSETEIVQFHYPFSKMVLATENSLNGIGIAFLGLLSICFILFVALKLVFNFSKDDFFTSEAIKYFNLIGYGMIAFGIVQLAFDLITSYEKFDLTPPFFLALIGVVFLLIKEVFRKGKNIQDEIDLTI